MADTNSLSKLALLPIAPLSAADGSIQSLHGTEQQEVADHLKSGHVSNKLFLPRLP